MTKHNHPHKKKHEAEDSSEDESPTRNQDCNDKRQCETNDPCYRPRAVNAGSQQLLRDLLVVISITFRGLLFEKEESMCGQQIPKGLLITLKEQIAAIHSLPCCCAPSDKPDLSPLQRHNPEASLAFWVLRQFQIALALADMILDRLEELPCACCERKVVEKISKQNTKVIRLLILVTEVPLPLAPPPPLPTPQAVTTPYRFGAGIFVHNARRWLPPIDRQVLFSYDKITIKLAGTPIPGQTVVINNWDSMEVIRETVGSVLNNSVLVPEWQKDELPDELRDGPCGTRRRVVPVPFIPSIEATARWAFYRMYPVFLQRYRVNLIQVKVIDSNDVDPPISGVYSLDLAAACPSMGI